MTDNINLIVPRKPKSIFLKNLQPPILQKIFANRGISSLEDLSLDIKDLLNFKKLANIDKAVNLLFDNINNQNHIIIIGDFDADGATATTVAIKSLTMFGVKNIHFLVPDRFKLGYGLSKEIVNIAYKKVKNTKALLITVDNGISDLVGVNHAKSLGFQVIITDHHLPGNILPTADVIVNPNLKQCKFPSKNLAGVGVIFYVMLALRAKLVEENFFSNANKPKLSSLLDLVALGTIADLVPLDKNNRILVYQGLKRIKQEKCCYGIKELLKISKKELSNIYSKDLAFSVAPKLNAAGRLLDMSIGINCLLSDQNSVKSLANQLADVNQKRQSIEKEIYNQAIEMLNKKYSNKDLPSSLCLFDESWHQGVVGIIASRIKEIHNRPVIIFAMEQNSTLKGSGRSIKGFHLRDALVAINNKHPSLIIKFGGHAMAAGLSIKKDNFSLFYKEFNKFASQKLSKEQLMGKVFSDGSLNEQELNYEFAKMLRESMPWGQEFEEPCFDNKFKVIGYNIINNKHLKLKLLLINNENNTSINTIDAIFFNFDLTKWTDSISYIHMAYQLDINQYSNQQNIQLLAKYIKVLD